MVETIKLNKRIYNRSALEQAIDDWQEWADFDIREEEDCFLVEIKPKSEQENIQDEFLNYVLEIMG